jgi:hypothetical protein
MGRSGKPDRPLPLTAQARAQVPCHALRALIRDFVDAHPHAEPVVLL